MYALEPQPHDHREPHRSTTHHQRRVVLLQRRLLHRMDADRERLGQGRVIGGQSVGYLQQQRRRQHHLLAVAARKIVGIADRAMAVGLRDHRHRADQRAGLQLALGARTVIQHFAAEFVAEHDVARQVEWLAAGDALRERDHVRCVLGIVQVRTADAAAQRLHQHLSRCWHRRRDVCDDDVAAAQDRRLHLMNSRVVVTKSSSRSCCTQWPARSNSTTFAVLKCLMRPSFSGLEAQLSLP